jgi:hypothetical protein
MLIYWKHASLIHFDEKINSFHENFLIIQCFESKAIKVLSAQRNISHRLSNSISQYFVDLNNLYLCLKNFHHILRSSEETESFLELSFSFGHQFRKYKRNNASIMTDKIHLLHFENIYIYHSNLLNYCFLSCFAYNLQNVYEWENKIFFIDEKIGKNKLIIQHSSIKVSIFLFISFLKINFHMCFWIIIKLISQTRFSKFILMTMIYQFNFIFLT